jgi:hypothetical protein
MSAFKLTQTPKYPHYFREMKWYWQQHYSLATQN